MNSQLLPLIGLLAATPLAAQDTPGWIRTADEVTKVGTAVAVDASDNAYVTSSDGSIWLRKYDHSGNELWEVRDTSDAPLNHLWPSQVHVTPNGEPVVVGYRYTLNQGNEQHANAVVVHHFDADGAFIDDLLIDMSFYPFFGFQTVIKVSSVMDDEGNLYLGTAGMVVGQSDTGFVAIKVTPTGNIAWVSTKEFGTDFHHVENIRLKDGRLGVVGTTDFWMGPPSTWVLDTVGTDLWNNISTGFRGMDLAFDDNLNAYVLPWFSENGIDVVLYKFCPNGGQLWSTTYNFDGAWTNERATGIETTADGNVAIMAYGSVFGSAYPDWITAKVSPDDDVIWQQRYDGLLGIGVPSSDEMPQQMVVDANNNIYVAGMAGPSPGAGIAGPRELVIAKYSTAGALNWYSAYDTVSIYNTVVGMELDNQGGLYVLSSERSTLIHRSSGMLTAVEELRTPSELTVSPNPVSTTLTVRGVSGNAPLLILDALGRQIAFTNERTIDVSAWSDGAYAIRSIAGEPRICARFIIAH